MRKAEYQIRIMEMKLLRKKLAICKFFLYNKKNNLTQ